MAHIKAKGRNCWAVRVFLGRGGDGKQLFRNKVIHGTKHDAERWAADATRDRDMAGTGVEQHTLVVGALLDDLLLDYQATNKAKSIEWAEMVARVHLRPTFGDHVASRVNSNDIRAYVAARQKAGAANGTINRELAILRRAFNLARVAVPPRIQRVPHFPMLREAAPRKGFLEDAQYRALLAELPEYLKPVLAFAFWTGCRKGEILGLEWRQLDLVRGTARLDPGSTKNDDSRLIPLAAELREMLIMQKAKRDQFFPGCRWVFFGTTGQPVREMRKAWACACQRAGLWLGDEKTGHPTVIFHDTRRSGVRNLVRAGVPEKVCMAISGHRTRSIFDRYNIVSEADILNAAVQLQTHIDATRQAGSCTPVALAPSGKASRLVQ